MRIPRVHSDQALGPGHRIELDPKASHHLVRVLRLAPGAALRVFDGRGAEYSASLVEAGPPARVELGEALPIGTESPLRITVAQSVAKGERMDYALQKCVELGVSAIQPLFTARCVVRLEGSRLARRQAHWEGVLASACEQSGRVQLPTLRPARELHDWFATGPATDAQAWMLDPGAANSLASAVLDRREVVLLIGPEGGLSEEESVAAAGVGFQGVRLGPRILRTETAAIVALSILQARFGDLA